MIESSKQQHLFEIQIFCNIINVTFDQFNASLKHKNRTDPRVYNMRFTVLYSVYDIE